MYRSGSKIRSQGQLYVFLHTNFICDSMQKFCFHVQRYSTIFNSFKVICECVDVAVLDQSDDPEALICAAKHGVKRLLVGHNTTSIWPSTHILVY
jgi:hypothetical protein